MQHKWQEEIAGNMSFADDTDPKRSSRTVTSSLHLRPYMIIYIHN